MDTPMTADPTPTESPANWLQQNATSLLAVAAAIGVMYWRNINLWDVSLAAFGLTFIIFLHELGHFVAAKLCRVRVEMFSIGFGPALPFCSYKYGETTYKLALVPLGGFVKMLGEGDGANDDDADTDPRSFKNQSVLERMFIISAGVIMNILLGIAVFVVVYMHGLEEKPAVIAMMEPGGTAWRQGIRSGTDLVRIGGQSNPWFDDIRPIVWSTSKGEKLPMTLSYKGEPRDISAEPLKDDGAPFPMLGILPPESLQLLHGRRMEHPPLRVGSPAAAPLSGQFQPGDTIVGMTDPDDPMKAVTPLTPKPTDPPGEYFVYQRRLARLAGQPITFTIRSLEASAGDTRSITVAPAFRHETGLRMRMGAVVAVRVGSTAETAGVRAKDGTTEGDRIVAVEVQTADKSVVTYSNDGPSSGSNLPLDPVQLPTQLNHWADATPGPKTVKLTVLREKPDDHTEKRETLTLTWDAEARFDLTGIGGANTPVPLNALGLAYHVQAVVDAVTPGSPAAVAGLQPNDTIEAVRFKVLGHDGTTDDGRWEPLKPNQWGFVDGLLQRVAPHTCDLKVTRKDNKLDVTVAASPGTLPVDDRGLELLPEFRIQKANDVGEALNMGFHRTLRMIRGIYINLYAMVFGRVSAVQTMSGPITLARASYFLAGESVWRLLLMLALISINLAVVNFLPIPVLDGGHMMFLVYEMFVGKPPPERVHTILTIVGLCCVLAMMLFVIGLDVYRLLKLWLKW